MDKKKNKSQERNPIGFKQDKDKKHTSPKKDTISSDDDESDTDRDPDRDPDKTKREKRPDIEANKKKIVEPDRKRREKFPDVEGDFDDQTDDADLDKDHHQNPDNESPDWNSNKI
ncbi:MAG TPA: hypothetical protein VK177_13705 [Flavobacteriales bacterium]|nr:hypothetical protein [Flavobacteriales bacterium]